MFSRRFEWVLFPTQGCKSGTYDAVFKVPPSLPEKINVFSKKPNKMGLERWGKKPEKGGGR
jgi:hypothetical protein